MFQTWYDACPIRPKITLLSAMRLRKDSGLCFPWRCATPHHLTVDIIPMR
jgi:hypothetical protein